jgi:uncharacterized LabA/DUF88 family protein
MSEMLNKTAVFWDYENVPFSSTDLTNYLRDIEEMKKGWDKGSHLKCFGDWKRVPEATQSEIRLSGFELIQVPQTKKNAVDQAITISAINLYHQTHYNDFILISADGDFTALLMDLKNKDVKISIIARKKTLSKDLIQYCSNQFLLTSNGYIFQSVLKSRSEILDAIECSIVDAQQALNNLAEQKKEFNIQIFRFEEWKKAFLNLENFQIQPLILIQLINLKEIFKIFVNKYGYGHTANFSFLCIHSTKEFTSLSELDIDKKVLIEKYIKLPIQTIPKTEYKRLFNEFGIEGSFETDDSLEKIGTLDNRIYLKAITTSFMELSKEENSNRKVKLSQLNNKISNLLGIPPSKKIYKQFGYKSFTEAVETAKERFPKKVTIKKDTISY